MPGVSEAGKGAISTLKAEAGTCAWRRVFSTAGGSALGWACAKGSCLCVVGAVCAMAGVGSVLVKANVNAAHTAIDHTGKRGRVARDKLIQ